MVSESELDGSKMEIISSFLDTKSIDVAQKEAIISLFGRYSWGVLEHDKFKIIKLYSGNSCNVNRPKDNSCNVKTNHGLFNYCNGVLKCHSISELNGHIVNELIILLVVL